MSSSGSGVIVTVALAVTVLAGAAAARQTFELEVEAASSLEPLARRVRDVNSERLARALEQAGLAVPPRVRVTLVAEDDPRARSTPAWVAGQAFGTDRITIFPQRVTSYPYDSLEAVVRHEIVHLALTRRAGGNTIPRWFHEGVAMTVAADWGVKDQVRLLLAALDRPTISDVNRLFTSDASSRMAQAYLLAGALVNDLRQRHGPGVPGAIVQHVAAGVPFDRAFERETGQTVDQAAARAWTGYRRLSRWIPAITSPSAVWAFILALSFVAFVAQVRRRLRRRRRWEFEEDLSLDE